MRKILLFLSVLMFIINISFAQSRQITRGAEPGELYITGAWYGIYNPIGYDTLRMAIYRLTENGKKLTIQYDADFFAFMYTPPGSIMQPYHILADVTPGVLYSVNYYHKNNYEHTSLWVSFDYGKNWIFREENFGGRSYYTANVEGIVYRGNYGEVSKSVDCGQSFVILDNISRIGEESGLNDEEFFSLHGSPPIYPYKLEHTYDSYITYNEIIIDSQFVYGEIWSIFPDVYRGGKEGEVYVSSMFLEENHKATYKVSFSADTGHTFRHVYVSEKLDKVDAKPFFMSDREPGVFYIIKTEQVEDFNPWGEYYKICIEYYRDYGETLVATYCHDLHKNYGKSCETVHDLVSEKLDNNTVHLSWSEPESSLPVQEYRIYRNEEFLEATTNSTYLDENLPIGEYDYYVITHYEMDCVSDSSNHVQVEVEVGVEEYLKPNFSIIPNPATNQVTISSATPFHTVEMINFLGQTVVSQTAASNSATLNISHLNNGIYFVRVIFEDGSNIKKLVKQ